MELSLPPRNSILASRTSHSPTFPPTMLGDPFAGAASSYKFLFLYPLFSDYTHLPTTAPHTCLSHTSSCLLMAPSIPSLGPNLRVHPCMQTLSRSQRLYLQTVSQILSLFTISTITTWVQATSIPHLGCY